jgi:hypothetical protein
LRRDDGVIVAYRTPIGSASLSTISLEETRLLGVDGAEDAIVYYFVFVSGDLWRSGRKENTRCAWAT